MAGIADALEGKHPAVPVDVVHRALREIHERADAVRRQRFRAMAAEGVKYLEENAKKRRCEQHRIWPAIPRDQPVVKAQFRHVLTAFVFITPVN